MPMRYFLLKIYKPAASLFDADFLDCLVAPPPFPRNSGTLKESASALQCSQRACVSEHVQPKVTSVDVTQRIRRAFLVLLYCVGALQICVYTYVCLCVKVQSDVYWFYHWYDRPAEQSRFCIAVREDRGDCKPVPILCLLHQQTTGNTERVLKWGWSDICTPLGWQLSLAVSFVESSPC